MFINFIYNIHIYIYIIFIYNICIYKKKKKNISKMIVFLNFFYNSQILEYHEVFIYTNEKKCNIHHFIYIIFIYI